MSQNCILGKHWLLSHSDIPRIPREAPTVLKSAAGLRVIASKPFEPRKRIGGQFNRPCARRSLSKMPSPADIGSIGSNKDELAIQHHVALHRMAMQALFALKNCQGLLNGANCNFRLYLDTAFLYTSSRPQDATHTTTLRSSGRYPVTSCKPKASPSLVALQHGTGINLTPAEWISVP